MENLDQFLAEFKNNKLSGDDFLKIELGETVSLVPVNFASYWRDWNNGNPLSAATQLSAEYAQRCLYNVVLSDGTVKIFDATAAASKNIASKLKAIGDDKVLTIKRESLSYEVDALDEPAEMYLNKIDGELSDSLYDIEGFIAHRIEQTAQTLGQTQVVQNVQDVLGGAKVVGGGNTPF
jgi:hypothetical protein